MPGLEEVGNEGRVEVDDVFVVHQPCVLGLFYLSGEEHKCENVR